MENIILKVVNEILPFAVAVIIVNLLAKGIGKIMDYIRDDSDNPNNYY